MKNLNEKINHKELMKRVINDIAVERTNMSESEYLALVDKGITATLDDLELAEKQNLISWELDNKLGYVCIPTSKGLYHLGAINLTEYKKDLKSLAR